MYGRLLPLLLALSLSLNAQQRDSLQQTYAADDHEIHAVNPLISTPLVLGFGYLAARRADNIRDKGVASFSEIRQLNPDDVNGLDRWATRQDANDRSQALFNSDYMQNIGQSLPLGLMIWKKYRREFLDIGLMYLEAQALQGMIYGYAPWGPSGTNRFRPLAYYDDFDLEVRAGGNERNSTYSGHVSTTATGFFFTAKMIDDFNPDLKPGQKILLYTGAFIPSAYSGYLRIKGLKHFPTDVALGLSMGALSGIMVPQMHKWWAKRHRSRMVAVPFYGGGAGGVGLSLRF